MSILEAWGRVSKPSQARGVPCPVPSSRACSDFLLKAAGNRAEALQEPVPTAGDPTERELWTWHALHLRLCLPSPQGQGEEGAPHSLT